MATTVVPARIRRESPQLIAPLWHTLVLLVFLSIPAVIGAMLQRQNSGPEVFAYHSQAMLRFYMPVLVCEWLLVLYVWFGVRKHGGTLRSLIGGSWTNWRKVAIDAGIAVLVLLAMFAIGALLSRVLGPDHAKGTKVLLPQTGSEMALWVGIAVTAGFVEELVYRGYLQTQLARLGLPSMLAILGQALIFGLGHAYEGRNAVLVIIAYALVFGMVAYWRRSLRPGMVAHAWFDIVVVFLLPR